MHIPRISNSVFRSLRFTPENKKAQLSFELLIVLAALISLLLALSPQITATSRLSTFAIKDKQMQFSFERILQTATEVNLLSKGSQIASFAYFPANFQLYSDKISIKIDYLLSGKNRSFARPLDFILNIPKTQFLAGKYLLRAENFGDLIGLDFDLAA